MDICLRFLIVIILEVYITLNKRSIISHFIFSSIFVVTFMYTLNDDYFFFCITR